MSEAIALVIGATAGIGAACAQRLAADGAIVVVAGRNAGAGEAVASAITSAGGQAHFRPVDVTDPMTVAGLVAGVLDEHGRLDIAVNSAGVFDRAKDFDETDDDDWAAVIDTNLTGVFTCMREQLRAMAPAGRGSIVNIASTVGHVASLRAGPAYVAAKHGVLGLTRQAAAQYVDRGVRVNAVSPGPTATDMAAPLIAEGDRAVAEALAGLTPMRRFVDPDEVAAAVAWLCSDGARSVTGRDIVIDGGQLAQM